MIRMMGWAAALLTVVWGNPRPTPPPVRIGFGFEPGSSRGGGGGEPRDPTLPGRIDLSHGNFGRIDLSHGDRGSGVGTTVSAQPPNVAARGASPRGRAGSPGNVDCQWTVNPHQHSDLYQSLSTEVNKKTPQKRGKFSSFARSCALSL